MEPFKEPGLTELRGLKGVHLRSINTKSCNWRINDDGCGAIATKHRGEEKKKRLCSGMPWGTSGEAQTDLLISGINVSHVTLNYNSFIYSNLYLANQTD